MGRVGQVGRMDWMLGARVIAAVLAIVGTACSSGSPSKQYDVRGQVLQIDLDRNEVTLRHEAIRGYMDAMTMPFPSSDRKSLEALAAGDHIEAVLRIDGSRVDLAPLRRTGHTDLPQADSQPSGGLKLLKAGDLLPDGAFIDQDSRPRTLSEARGKAVAVTFIYTRCPLPTFCPLMDRNFAALQRLAQQEPALRDDVQLFSITFDPDFDTPPVLKAHAKMVGANLRNWAFLTGPHAEVVKVGEPLGLIVSRDETDEIGHTLRTVVLDRSGRIVRIHTGNAWTPEQVLEDLKSAIEQPKPTI